MNRPSAYKKALKGFNIPPRSLTEMLSGALMGGLSLFDEEGRKDFTASCDDGSINEAVLSQASMGRLMVLALHNDFQNPLLKRYKFDSVAFLEGVAPALQNFHDISGSLENEFDQVYKNIQKEDAETSAALKHTAHASEIGATNADLDAAGVVTSNSNSSTTTSIRQERDALLKMYNMTDLFPSRSDQDVIDMMNRKWWDDIEKEPESLAGQLSRMVTPELFDIIQVNSRVENLLQGNQQRVRYQEGSCRVNNVAFISARATTIDKEMDLDNWTTDSAIDDNRTTKTISNEIDNDHSRVAAQIEVLYDVTRDYIVDDDDNSDDNNNSTDNKKPIQVSKIFSTTVLSVAVLEGFLHGNPIDNGDLRWRLALHRYASEFVGV